MAYQQISKECNCFPHESFIDKLDKIDLTCIPEDLDIIT